MTNHCDRLLLLSRLLDPGDYRFIEFQNPGIARRFRSQRMRIVQAELWEMAREVGSKFRVRASRIDAAGYWRAYPALVGGTALTFFSIAKLRIACMLFGLRLPVLFDVQAATRRVGRFTTGGELSITPSHSRA